MPTSTPSSPTTAPPRKPGTKRSVGRPRSEATRQQILSTTIQLLRTQSVQSISIETIAREAGVGKATIYRWWSSKVMVVIDAFVEHHIAKTPIAKDRSPGDALALHFKSLVHEYAGWSGRLVAQIIAEAQSDPEALREFSQRFHSERRDVIRKLLDAWRKDANIPTPADIELLGDMIYAPAYTHLLLKHAPLDDAFIYEHLRYVYGLLGAKLPPEILALAGTPSA